jgi:hypothetical protein
VRWGHHTFREVDDMTLAEWSVLNRSFLDYPPTDILVAAYMGYKGQDAETGKPKKMFTREAAKANSAALQTLVHPKLGTLGEMLGPRKGQRQKTAADLPAYLNNPHKQALIAKMRAEMEASRVNNAG